MTMYPVATILSYVELISKIVIGRNGTNTYVDI